MKNIPPIRILLPAAVMLFAGLLPSHAASILVNGDLETQNPQVAANGKITSGFSTLTGWNNTGNPANDTGIQGANYDSQKSESGTYFTFLQGGETGAYQITNTTLNAGDTFTLTWYAYNSYQNPVQQVSLFTAVTPTDLFSATTAVAIANSSTNSLFALTGAYQQYTLTYTALPTDAGKYIGVSFQNVGNGGTYINMDNFVLNVTPVPEPATWIAMLAGAGVLMLFHRRRLA